MPQVVRALLLDVDEHQMAGQETEKHNHSRLNEPPLVIESNLTTGGPWPPVEWSVLHDNLCTSGSCYIVNIARQQDPIYTRVDEPNQLNELLLDVTYVYYDHVRVHNFVNIQLQHMLCTILFVYQSWI